MNNISIKSIGLKTISIKEVSLKSLGQQISPFKVDTEIKDSILLENGSCMLLENGSYIKTEK